jgi:hypothetical protein
MEEEATDWNMRLEILTAEINLYGQLTLDPSHHRPDGPGKWGQFLEWIVLISNHKYCCMTFNNNNNNFNAVVYQYIIAFLLILNWNSPRRSLYLNDFVYFKEDVNNVHIPVYFKFICCSLIYIAIVNCFKASLARKTAVKFTVLMKVVIWWIVNNHLCNFHHSYFSHALPQQKKKNHDDKR